MRRYWSARLSVTVMRRKIVVSGSLAINVWEGGRERNEYVTSISTFTSTKNTSLPTSTPFSLSTTSKSELITSSKQCYVHPTITSASSSSTDRPLNILISLRCKGTVTCTLTSDTFDRIHRPRMFRPQALTPSQNRKEDKKLFGFLDCTTGQCYRGSTLRNTRQTRLPWFPPCLPA